MATRLPIFPNNPKTHTVTSATLENHLPEQQLLLGARASSSQESIQTSDSLWSSGINWNGNDDESTYLQYDPPSPEIPPRQPILAARKASSNIANRPLPQLPYPEREGSIHSSHTYTSYNAIPLNPQSDHLDIIIPIAEDIEEDHDIDGLTVNHSNITSSIERVITARGAGDGIEFYDPKRVRAKNNYILGHSPNACISSPTKSADMETQPLKEADEPAKAPEKENISLSSKKHKKPVSFIQTAWGKTVVALACFSLLGGAGSGIALGAFLFFNRRSDNNTFAANNVDKVTANLTESPNVTASYDFIISTAATTTASSTATTPTQTTFKPTTKAATKSTTKSTTRPRSTTKAKPITNNPIRQKMLENSAAESQLLVNYQDLYASYKRLYATERMQEVQITPGTLNDIKEFQEGYMYRIRQSNGHYRWQYALRSSTTTLDKAYDNSYTGSDNSKMFLFLHQWDGKGKARN